MEKTQAIPVIPGTVRAMTRGGLLLGMIVYGCGVFANTSEYRSREELDELRGRIDALQERLDTDREQETLVSSDLLGIEKQAAALVLERQQNNARLEDLKVEKMQTNARIFTLKGQENVMRERIAGIIKSSFMQKQKDALSIALDGGSPTESLQTMLLGRYIVESRQQRIDQIRGLKTAYSSTVDAIQVQEKEISRLLSELEANAEAISRLEKARQKELAKIRASLADNEKRVVEYRAREKELEDLLSSLTRQKKLSEPRPAPSVKPTLENTGTQTKNLTASLTVAEGFGKNQGKLQMPTQGRIINRFGQVRPESGLQWDGIMLGVSEGQSVNAIFNGQVVFSDWFGSYGQLLVLDHGEGYMSIYGHNQILNVELGSSVMAGDQIALTGVTGGLDEPGLYFEIRYNGTPTDPLKWCRL